MKDPNTWVDVFGLDCENITPRKANNLEGGPLENATQVSGRFPLENGPINGTLFRADNQDNVTSYAVYDDKGMIMKRVDVTGAAHRGVPTPHVIEYGRNTYTDSDGNTITRVQSPDTKARPRPATKEEIP
ncbi:polymorphic toxin type 24 domain-containing protein [Treponema pedis]|uniref:polymorphic toxin type 24 domain-containing protein n=1 Tax=Treponema pedis TaxID=409322 RepID=UPI001C07C1DA|nr:polymorphic toxin type 24 domain-containing protein [Treponema pedis]